MAFGLRTRRSGLIALIDLGQPGQKLEAHEDPDSIYIWRLMVAEHHQGKGHGIDAPSIYRATLPTNRKAPHNFVGG